VEATVSGPPVVPPNPKSSVANGPGGPGGPGRTDMVCDDVGEGGAAARKPPQNRPKTGPPQSATHLNPSFATCHSRHLFRFFFASVLSATKEKCLALFIEL
jgi:hypothetical protein